MSDFGGAATAAAVRRDFGGSAALAQRLLNFVLFVTVLTSSIAFIEPSPHDGMIFALLTMCVAAHVRFDRKLVPLFVLLIVWLVGGLLSLIQVGDQAAAVQYGGTSIYLALAAGMFACLFSDGNLLRLAVLRQAYILAALIATAAGYIGYFHLLPGADIFLADTDGSESFARVSATFKDPNVYGPFLIFPLLILLSGFLTRGVRLAPLVAMIALLGGLFLSFSRGAWANFAVSAAICFVITFAVTPEPRERRRMILLGLAVVLAVALLEIAVTSVESIHAMFLERAKALQPYDVGPGGRFWLQRVALGMIFDHPDGLGPFAFGLLFGTQQHNVYLQAFLVYGWLGGAAYLAIAILTLAVGFAALGVATPWQQYFIVGYAAFVGNVLEGMIVDTDHWRHFFLLLGLVWGLAVATINYQRRFRWQTAAALGAGVR